MSGAIIGEMLAPRVTLKYLLLDLLLYDFTLSQKLLLCC